MKTLKITFAALMLAAAAPVGLAEEAAQGETAALANTITAEVNGMVCDFCAQAAEKVMGKEDGVTDVAVNLDDGTITITLEEGATLSDERIEELVKKSGYDLVAVKRGDA